MSIKKSIVVEKYTYLRNYFANHCLAATATLASIDNWLTLSCITATYVLYLDFSNAPILPVCLPWLDCWIFIEQFSCGKFNWKTSYRVLCECVSRFKQSECNSNCIWQPFEMFEWDEQMKENKWEERLWRFWRNSKSLIEYWIPLRRRRVSLIYPLTLHRLTFTSIYAHSDQNRNENQLF